VATVPADERVARIVVVVVGVFLLVAAAFALTVLVTLLAPGTLLDDLWAMKAGSREQFVGMGAGGIALLLALAVVLVPTGIGLLRRWRWTRWVAVALLAANVVPDLVQGFAGKPEIFVPIVPVAAILVYLVLPVVGRTFRPRPAIANQSARISP
jgi:hypothetical protein